MGGQADVVLVHPLFTKEEQYGFKVKEIGNVASPPLGLVYIAAVLEQNRIPVAIVDANAEGLAAKGVAQRVEALGARIVGVTAATPMITNAFRVVKSVKETLPQVTTVLGGPHASALPAQTLEDCPELDFVAVGEGEATALELFGLLLSGQRDGLDKIKGIAYRQEGRVVVTPARPLCPDINLLPLPARHLLPMQLYRPSLVNYRRLPQTSVMCSRGCPYACIFCTKHLFGRIVRWLTPERVYEELKHLVETYGIREIDFYDEAFFIHREWTERVCQLIAPLHLLWQCNGKVNSVHPDLLKKMRASGCYRINYGVESGNDKSLKLLRKGNNTQMVREAFRLTREAGMETLAYAMLGIPGENWEDMMRTIEFVKELKATDAVFSILTPFPGNEIYINVEKYGTLRRQDWEAYLCISEEPVFMPYGVTLEEMRLAMRKAYREFALKPGYVWYRFRDALHSPHKFVPYTKGALSLLFS